MREKAIDIQLIKPVKVGTSASKGKVILKSLFKEYFNKLNVGYYDPCCDDDVICPLISDAPDNVLQCNTDGLFVAYQDAGGGGSVTSVGLTMPAAFSVGGSPVTSSGILAVTMSGTTSQYLRGDGTLATFPIIVGNIDQVLAAGGVLTTSRTMSLGSSVFTILDSGDNPIFTLNQALELSIGDTDGATSGLLLKIDLNNKRTFLGNINNNITNILVDDLNNQINLTTNLVTISNQLKIVGGTPGVGKVLTSDSAGLASWQTSGAGFWTSSTTNNINNTNAAGVGIQVTNPTAYLHIKDGTTAFAPLKFTSGSLLAAPENGAVEYDGVNLYFTVGTTRRIFPLGVTDTTVYTGDGSIAGVRAINAQGYSITWNNIGLFRLIEGDATVGGTYDFNNGIDFLSFDANNSSNLILNPITGLTFEYTDVPGLSVLSSLSVNGTGIKLTGIDEYADNAAAIVGGLTVGYVYRTGDNLKIVH